MLFDILSLFPDYFQGPFDVSMIKRAKEKGLIEIGLHNLRDFAKGKHRKVDDRPYGGGPGMVLMPEPVIKGIRHLRKEGTHVVYLSPQGKVLNPVVCQRLAKLDHLVLLCGHYEGLDERVIETEVDEEISIGDYVLTNGCAAAIILIDAVARFIPGVIGHEEAVWQDSFQDKIFEGPQYTRPDIIEGQEVPSILKDGNHEKIRLWRRAKAVEKTRRVRPDLMGEGDFNK